MRRLSGFVNAVLPALLMAASVTLLAAGLLAWGAPFGPAQPPAQATAGATGAGTLPTGEPLTGDPGDLPSPPATPAVPATAPPCAGGRSALIGPREPEPDVVSRGPAILLAGAGRGGDADRDPRRGHRPADRVA